MLKYFGNNSGMKWRFGRPLYFVTPANSVLLSHAKVCSFDVQCTENSWQCTVHITDYYRVQHTVHITYYRIVSGLCTLLSVQYWVHTTHSADIPLTVAWLMTIWGLDHLHLHAHALITLATVHYPSLHLAALYWTALHCPVLSCSVLHWTILYCIVMFCTALR